MAGEKVNNELYRELGHEWWDEEVGEFTTLRYAVNPARFGYFRRILEKEPYREPSTLSILDVGCGGGVLSEDFARLGCKVTGIDPAAEAIEAARVHAAASGLTIKYGVGVGEHLPFAEATYDCAACCDVLEHVDDADRVIGEVSRVLKPGGLFFYDTVNRTFMSKLGAIKVMQEWRCTAFAQPNSHVWEKFIKPAELRAMLERHGLDHREMRGLTSAGNPIAILLNFHRRVKNRISFKELGRRIAFHESDDLRISYMGWAVKKFKAA